MTFVTPLPSLLYLSLSRRTVSLLRQFFLLFLFSLFLLELCESHFICNLTESNVPVSKPFIGSVQLYVARNSFKAL